MSPYLAVDADKPFNTAERKLRANLKEDPATGCWIWCGRMAGSSPAPLRVSGETHMPRDLAYALWVDPIPYGMRAINTCDNRACCNPKHLSLAADKALPVLRKPRPDPVPVAARPRGRPRKQPPTAVPVAAPAAKRCQPPPAPEPQRQPAAPRRMVLTDSPAEVYLLGRVKLYPVDIRAIRSHSGSLEDIGRIYGLSIAMIDRIRRRQFAGQVQ
jgi:hypothetical protein